MSEAKDFFCSPLKGSSILKARSKSYGASTRTTADIQWLTQKRCRVTAAANGVVLSTPTGGGLPRTTKTSTSLYKLEEKGIYRPQPYITSVVVDTAGELGSLRQGKISFTANSLTQVNSLTPFFQIGADIVINAAWSGAPASVTGPSYSFQGIVHNFSFTLNENGGFDCITEFTGKGVNVLGTKIGETEQKVKLPANVLSGAVEAYANLTNILTYIRQGALTTPITLTGLYQYRNNAYITSNDPRDFTEFASAKMDVNGAVVVDFPARTLSLDDNERLKQSAVFNASEYTEAQTGDIKTVFITLTGLLSIIENLIISSIGGNSQFRIECETQNIPSRDPSSTDFSSINPYECIFPGYTKSYEASGNVLKNTKIGKTNGAGIILINIDWVLFKLSEFAQKRDSVDKNLIETGVKFINEIFDMLFKNSGGFFKFTLVQSKITPEKWLVVNNAYINEDVTYYTIPIQTYKSVARNVNLVGKLPSEMLAEAYVKARGDGTPNAATPGNSGLTATKVVTAALQNSIAPSVTIDYLTILENGLTQDAVNRLSTEIEKIVNADADTNGNFASLVPIELSMTLDGIADIEYGNVFAVNYIPSNLTDPERIFFMITQVTQNFTGTGDWTTDIKSIMRIRPSKTAPAKEESESTITSTTQTAAITQQNLQQFAEQDNTRTSTGGVFIDPNIAPSQFGSGATINLGGN